MPALGYTASELAEKSKKTRHAVEQWLSSHGIKPVSYEAIYPLDILDELKKSKRGRPAKKPADQKPPEPLKKAKKP